MIASRIKLRIVSDIMYFPDESPSHTDMTTDAALIETDDKITIEYDEFLSDDDGITHTALSFSRKNPETVFLTRSGEVDMTCVIEEKKRYSFRYDMGIAFFDIIAVGKKVKNKLIDKSKSAHFVYDMEMNGTTVQTCDLKMHIQ